VTIRTERTHRCLDATNDLNKTGAFSKVILPAIYTLCAL
jgi:hypothetical protein